MDMRRIEVMIGGAQKAGTTTLKNWLAQHPEVCSHVSREFTYFVNDEEYASGNEQAYARYFRHCGLSQSVLLAKSVGVMYSVEAIGRLKEHNSEVQLVVVLRNPVDRAYSAYWFARRTGLEDLEQFENAVKAGTDRFKGDWVRERTCAYLSRGEYVHFLPALFGAFGEALSIYILEDLKEEPLRVCKQILRRVGIASVDEINVAGHSNPAAIARSEKLARWVHSDQMALRFLKGMIPNRWKDRLRSSLQRWNRAGERIPPMEAEIRDWLHEYYQPYNEALAELIDRDLAHWNARQS